MSSTPERKPRDQNPAGARNFRCSTPYHHHRSAAEETHRAAPEFEMADNQAEPGKWGGLRLLDELRADVIFATRRMLRQPGFTLTAILFLGAAIGLNTSLFTFLNAFLLRPLPIAGAERHVDITGFRSKQALVSEWNAREFEVLARQAAPVAELYGIERVAGVVRDGSLRKAAVEIVTDNFLPLAQARMQLGRPFAPETREPAAVLSDAGWQHLFQRDAGIVGRRIRIGESFFVVTGVAEARFTGVEVFTPDVWVSRSFRKLLTRAAEEKVRAGAILHAGVDPRQAPRILSGAIPALREGVRPEEQITEIVVVPRATILRAGDADNGALSLPILAFVILLLVACANLASLNLAGTYARQRELAIRLSLGASRERVLRQLCTEALLLSGLGGLLALLLAWLSLETLQAWLFQVVTRAGLHIAPLSLDVRVFAFAMAMAALAAVVFGLAPALQATASANLVSAASQHSGLGRRAGSIPLHRLLITGQTAANLVLMVLAGMLILNAARMDARIPGFPVERIYDPGFEGDLRAFAKRLEENARVAAVSGVRDVPLWGVKPRRPMTAEGHARSLAFSFVDHRFFETMQIPLRDGRAFTAAEAAAESPVTIVSEATARTLWPGTSAIGKILEVGDPEKPDAAPRPVVVVGVAADVVSGLLVIGPDPHMVYFPAGIGSAPIRNLVVRTHQADARFKSELQEECLALNPASLCQPWRLDELAGMQRAPVRMATQVATALGVVALLLSAVGLHGVVAFTVVRRTREAGIRAALGASPWMLVRAMLAPSLRGVAVGIAIGWPVCFALAKLADSAAEYLKLASPAVFAAAPSVLIAVAVLAVAEPAWRVTRVDPAVVLRDE
jgi:predicted permease